MVSIEQLATTLQEAAGPGIARKDLIAAVRERHPKASKKDIVRAAFEAHWRVVFSFIHATQDSVPCERSQRSRIIISSSSVLAVN